MLTLICDLELRLTRPIGEAVHVPWGAKMGFAWKRAEPVEIKGRNLMELAQAVTVQATRLLAHPPDDTVEAVKLDGYLTIDDVCVRYSCLREKN